MSTASNDLCLKFRPDLLSGEQLLWSGRPNPRVIFHSDDWYVIPFSIIWTGFFIFWEWGVVRDHSTFMTLWGVPFLIFGQYFVWGRFFYDAWLKRRTYYAVTNRRVLILQEAWRRKTNVIYLEAIPSMEREGDQPGTVWFGPKLPIIGSKRSPRRNISRFTFGDVPVFADVDDANLVYALVAELKQKSAHGQVINSDKLTTMT